jgi:hypothetical protein
MLNIRLDDLLSELYSVTTHRTCCKPMIMECRISRRREWQREIEKFCAKDTCCTRHLIIHEQAR